MRRTQLVQPLLQAGQRAGTGDKQAEEVCRAGLWWGDSWKDRRTDGGWVGGRTDGSMNKQRDG